MLVEGALMIALSTILSEITVFSLPHGGGITLVGMLPIILMSFRNGPKWGLFTAFVHSLIQFFLGMNNLAYCQTLTAQVGCVLFDYILAVTSLGLACTLTKGMKKGSTRIAVGTAAVCLLRFVCSFLSGYIVWRDYGYALEWLNNFSWLAWATEAFGETALCWFYSFAYNAFYMIPETILTTIVAVILYRAAPKLFGE